MSEYLTEMKEKISKGAVKLKSEIFEYDCSNIMSEKSNNVLSASGVIDLDSECDETPSVSIGNFSKKTSPLILDF